MPDKIVPLRRPEGKPPIFWPDGPTQELRNFVEANASGGTPHEDIAALIGEKIGRLSFSVESLHKYFQHELRLGRAKSNALMGRNIFDRAMAGDRALAIWWSKTQMGWKPPPTDVNNTIPGDYPRITPGMSDQEAVDIYIAAMRGLSPPK